jgi:RecA/RadA recombinase
MYESYGFYPAFEQSVVHHLCNDKRFFFLFQKYLEQEKLETPEARAAVSLAKSLFKDMGDAPGSSALILNRAQHQVQAGSLPLSDYMNLCFYLETATAVEDPMATGFQLTSTLKSHLRHAGTLKVIATSSADEEKRLEAANYLLEIENIGKFIEHRVPLSFELDGVSRDVFDAIEGLRNLERLPTGIDDLDMCFGGGIPRGNLTVIAGRAGAGKSLGLSEISAHSYAALGKVVALIVISEIPDALASTRVLAPIMGCRINDVLGNSAAENRRIFAAYKAANGHRMGGLKVFQYGPNTHVRVIRNEVMAYYRKFGIAPDVVAFDYLGLAGSHQAPANANGYNVGKFVTSDLLEWAQEDNLYLLTAVQAVRMKGRGDRTIVGLDDIADSQHVVRIADNVVSINVFFDDQGLNPEGQWLVVKHRMGQSGQLTSLSPVQYDRGLVGQSSFFHGIQTQFWGSVQPAFVN